jgi:hypothetical protein
MGALTPHALKHEAFHELGTITHLALLSWSTEPGGRTVDSQVVFQIVLFPDVGEKLLGGFRRYSHSSG